MANTDRLFLYEEVVLLARHNEKGTIATGYLEYAVAGAVLTELLLDRRISVDDSEEQLVNLHNTDPISDPIIDECLEEMKISECDSLSRWVSEIAGIRQLRHKAARQLCKRGILRADKDTVLFFFTRRVYPEINPVPERQIVDRLRKAIFTDTDQPDPRTVVLISLANGANLLRENFDPEEISARKRRIEQLVKGGMLERPRTR